MNLEQQLQFLLNKFELKDQIFNEAKIETLMDSKIYREFQKKRPDGRVVALIAFADGVTDQRQTFNTLIIQVYDLDTSVRLKTFLNGAAMSHSPNLNQMLDEFICALNRLWDEGIVCQKSTKRIYPYLHCFTLDGQARPDYLMLSHHNAECFCNGCLVEGKVIPSGKGYMRAFEHNAEKPIIRTDLMSRSVAEGIEHGRVDRRNIPFDGIKGRSPILDINYFDLILQVPPFEPMHTIMGGIVKRDYTSMQSSNSSGCYFNKAVRNVLHERMIKIRSYVNDNLKRDLSPFNKVQCWKTNQYADFMFYVAPIAFRSLIDTKVYGHHLAFIYLMTRLWDGGVGFEERADLNNLINIYLEQHKQLYPPTDQTSNLHSMDHFVETFFNLGPFSQYSAFIFESINGETKKLITGSKGMMEQIASRSEIDMMIMLKDELSDDTIEFSTRGVSVREDGKECFHSIKNKYWLIKSKEANDTEKDCYVMTSDYRFFLIKRIFKENNCIMCDGFEVVAEQTLQLIMGGKRRSIQHIFHAKIVYQLTTFNAQMIGEKVIFIPEFEDKSSQISNSSIGFVIRTVYKYHN